MRRDNWVRDAGVAGSNPATPTIFQVLIVSMFFRRNEMRNDLRHGSHSRRSWAYAKGLEERDFDDLEPLNLGKREGNSMVRRRARHDAELGLAACDEKGSAQRLPPNASAASSWKSGWWWQRIE